MPASSSHLVLNTSVHHCFLVVGKDTVLMRFFIVTINNLDICTEGTGNAFLYGKIRELVYVVVGQEFRNPGAKLVIDKGNYGLRSNSAKKCHEHYCTPQPRVNKIEINESSTTGTDHYLLRVI